MYIRGRQRFAIRLHVALDGRLVATLSVCTLVISRRTVWLSRSLASLLPGHDPDLLLVRRLANFERRRRPADIDLIGDRCISGSASRAAGGDQLALRAVLPHQHIRDFVDDDPVVEYAIVLPLVSFRLLIGDSALTYQNRSAPPLATAPITRTGAPGKRAEHAHDPGAHADVDAEEMTACWVSPPRPGCRGISSSSQCFFLDAGPLSQFADRRVPVAALAGKAGSGILGAACAAGRQQRRGDGQAAQGPRAVHVLPPARSSPGCRMPSALTGRNSQSARARRVYSKQRSARREVVLPVVRCLVRAGNACVFAAARLLLGAALAFKRRRRPCRAPYRPPRSPRGAPTLPGRRRRCANCRSSARSPGTSAALSLGTCSSMSPIGAPPSAWLRAAAMRSAAGTGRWRYRSRTAQPPLSPSWNRR